MKEINTYNFQYMLVKIKLKQLDIFEEMQLHFRRGQLAINLRMVFSH
jgi:hypothetical protein